MDWPGEKVINRVIDALENGIGGALRPWQIRRVGKANAEARAEERLLLEQAELDIADLKAGRKRLDANRKLIACDVSEQILLEGPTSRKSSPIELFEQTAQDATHAHELQRAVNLKKIALYAEEAAEDIDQSAESAGTSDQATPPEIDADWFARWRTGAQEVSKEEMQRLWGKLLAGEVSRPGSYSLHTVDFLSRMSSTDANLLAKVAPFVSNGGIIKVGDDFFTEKGLGFQQFLYLDDLGIINGATSIAGLTYGLGQSDMNGRAFSNLLLGTNIVLVFFIRDHPRALPCGGASSRCCLLRATLQGDARLGASEAEVGKGHGLRTSEPGRGRRKRDSNPSNFGRCIFLLYYKCL